MIRAVQNYFVSIPAVFIDGFLYFLIAVFGAALGVLTEDDAYKYINEFLLYWLKFVCKIGLAGSTAIKMFRSTGFSQHQDMKKAQGDTVILKKT